jgi:hypothetical protein
MAVRDTAIDRDVVAGFDAQHIPHHHLIQVDLPSSFPD